MHNEIDKTIRLADHMDAIEALVGVDRTGAVDICIQTVQQSGNDQWFIEVSKRITSSLFGKIINK